MEVDDERLSKILESVFAALDAEEDPDIEQLTGGDPELIARIHRLIGGESDAERALGALGGIAVDEGLPAERLGDFRLVSFLGAGGMGRVYLAEQESLGRMVALKVLDRSFTGDERAHLRFRREAEIAAALDHPNIVPVYGISEEQGFSCIAMKWLTGPALDAMAEPMAPREAARIGAAIADALDAAHRSGVVHRDVKPGNVILDVDVPYLVDFGLARGSGDQTLTAENTAPGTLQYIAPEKLRGDGDSRSFDPRGDVYSLGATLYQAVAGRPPFMGAQPERVIHQVLFRDPAPLRLKGADKDLETIILRALDKDPQGRFSSAAGLAEDLGRYLRQEPIESHPVGILSRSYKLIRRHRRVASWITALALVALVMGLVLLVRIWGERQVFREDLREAHLRIEAGQLDASRLLLSRLMRRDPGDSQLQAAMAQLREREHHALALIALEDLLDRIQDRPAAWIPDDLERLAAAVEEKGELRGDPAAERLRLLALAWVRLQQGASERALKALDEIEERLGRGRGLTALKALAEKRSGWRLPAKDPEASANEHIIAALGLRLAGRSRAEQRREIDAALRKEPDSFRAQLSLAVFLAGGPKPRVARDAFLLLPRPKRRSRSILRQIARLDLILGETAEAAARLAAAGPPRTGVEAGIDAQLLVQEGRFPEAERQLDLWLRRWPKALELKQVRTRLLLGQGREAEARELLLELSRSAGPASYREDARLALLAFELNDLMRSPHPDAAQRSQALRSYADRSWDIGSKAETPALRSQVMTLAARADRRAGELALAEHRLREALDVDQSTPAPHLEFAALSWELVKQKLMALGNLSGRDEAQSFNDRVRLLKELLPLALEGMDHAQRVRQWPKGTLSPSASERRSALLCEMFLARAADNPRRTITAGEALEQEIDRLPETHAFDAILAAVENHLAWAEARLRQR